MRAYPTWLPCFAHARMWQRQLWSWRADEAMMCAIASSVLARSAMFELTSARPTCRVASLGVGRGRQALARA
eukprot:8061511-Alexandrium_andersonii.AAC.1